MEFRLGLRIDVDTFRGTKIGVPALCKILEKHNIKASFFFSVGPDNMGRHIWRLIRPDFFIKMLRTKAGATYGWDIIFKGTFWPGPLIGKNLKNIIRFASKNGHEIGLHAWDHHKWQACVDKMSSDEIYASIKKGYDELSEILGYAPKCSAVPGWKCNEKVVLEKMKFDFLYNSDVRGSSVFFPNINDKIITQPQIPVTLPTYDEVIGRNNITNENYNDYILSLIAPDKLNVLTIHAEMEGISCANMFDDFIKKAKSKGIEFVTLGSLVSKSEIYNSAAIVLKNLPGREGTLAFQDI